MELQEALNVIKQNGGFNGCIRILTKENEAFHRIEKAILDDELKVREKSNE